MPIRVTNTLTQKKELFEPLQSGAVQMYVCGPTVYGYTHVGNARPVVFFDLVRRFLEFSGYRVTYVSNFTDVDDKIIQRARDEKTSSQTIADRYTKAFYEDMAALGVRLADRQPKVTEFIPQIIEFIKRIVASGSGYVAANGEVFFSVRSFASYGKLSKKNIDDLISGARVEPGEAKRDPLDFSLWKPQKQKDEPAWESPWGKGRPGWHIECSVMSTAILGESFDIHGGGSDLIHPHHENEIAQAECVTGKTFVKYWLHNNMLCLDREKMSKSLGNLFLTREIVVRYGAETIRYLLLSGHYRSTIDFSEKHISDVQSALHRIYSTRERVARVLTEDLSIQKGSCSEESALKQFSDCFSQDWQQALEDDFNTPKMLAHVFDYVRLANSFVGRKKPHWSSETKHLLEKFESQILELGRVANLFTEVPSDFLANLRARVLKERGLDEKSIEDQVALRMKARQAKDFAKADQIRDALKAQGVDIQDTPTTSSWDVFW